MGVWVVGGGGVVARGGVIKGEREDGMENGADTLN